MKNTTAPVKEPLVKPSKTPEKNPRRQNDPWNPPSPKIKESPKA